jgi:tetratricopeptide (TPR) repeat protein
LGSYAKALEAANDGLAIAKDPNTEAGMYPMEQGGFFTNAPNVRAALLANIYQKFGHLHRSTGNEARAVEYYLKAVSTSESVGDDFGASLYNISLGALYTKAGKLDSALLFLRKSLAICTASKNKLWLGYVYLDMSKLYLNVNNYDSVRYYLQATIDLSRQHESLPNVGEAYGGLARLFLTFQKPDSAIIYANYSLSKYQQLKDQRNIALSYATLANAYESTGNKDSSLKYLWYAKSLDDSITAADKVQTNRYQNLNFEEQYKLLNVQKEKIELEADVRMYALLAAITFFILLAIFLYYNNRSRKKANTVLQSQKQALLS